MNDHDGEHDRWHHALHHIKAGGLSGDTTQTSGMRRFEAISGKSVGSEKLWMGQTHRRPGRGGRRPPRRGGETAIYVVSARPCVCPGGGRGGGGTGRGGATSSSPYVPHREENPSPDDEAVVVIARSTQEGVVVNLPDLFTRVDEPPR